VKVGLTALSVEGDTDITMAVRRPSILYDMTEAQGDPAAFGDARDGYSRTLALMAIDRCGVTIPGDTPEDKLEWADEHLSVGVINDFDRVIQGLSGYPTVEWAIPEDRPDETDIAAATSATVLAQYIDRPATFRLHRAGRTYEWRVKHLSPAAKRRIDTEYPMPNPGDYKRRTQTGPKTVAQVKMEPDPEHPKLKALTAQCTLHRCVRTFDQALSFEIPGQTIEAKADWLRGRPAGDVAQLKMFVDDAGDYQNELAFF